MILAIILILFIISFCLRLLSDAFLLSSEISHKQRTLGDIKEDYKSRKDVDVKGLLSGNPLSTAKEVSSGLKRQYKDSNLFESGFSGAAKVTKVLSKLVSLVNKLLVFVTASALIVGVLMICLVILNASAFLNLYVEKDANGNMLWNDKAITELNASNNGFVNSSNAKPWSGVSDMSKPQGITEESWNSADDIGKKVVKMACDPILNPPNGKTLIYKQGNTPQGYADCSTFVCAVLQGALNKSFNGDNTASGYDFSSNKKADLQTYFHTALMQDYVSKQSGISQGFFNDNKDSAKPGDILLTSGHVGIFVGVNENGDYVMVHASTENGNCKEDINLTTGRHDVGFSKVTSNFLIVRTSKLVEGN